jgi:hypothetical protein
MWVFMYVCRELEDQVMELQAQVRCRSAYVVGCLCMYVGVCVYTQTGPQCAIVQQGLVLTCLLLLLGLVLTCLLLQCAIVQQGLVLTCLLGSVLTCLLGSVLTCILLQCAIVQQQCDSSMAQCRLQVP